MGEIIHMLSERAFVRQTASGWIAVVIEDGRRINYQFERKAWAEKFADDRRLAWFARNLGRRPPS